MNLVSQRVMLDYSLVHSLWLQVEILPEKTEQEILASLKKILFISSLRLKQSQVHQISFIFPRNWHTLAQKLSRLGWEKSLTTFELQLNNDTQSDNIPTHHLSNSVKDSSKIVKLLEEQAHYHAEHYPQYYQDDQKIPWNKYLEETTYDLKNSQALSVFWKENGTIVGMILGEIINKKAYMYDFIVLESQRGKGIGEKLLLGFAHKSQQKNATSIVTETWWDQPSTRLYQRLGYVAVSQEYFKVSE